MLRACKWKKILLWMPGGASVFSSKPLLPVNEENSTKKQTQRVISSSYNAATHSTKVGTPGESGKLWQTWELLKYRSFQRQILHIKTSTDSEKLCEVNNTWLLSWSLWDLALLNQLHWKLSFVEINTLYFWDLSSLLCLPLLDKMHPETPQMPQIDKKRE